MSAESARVPCPTTAGPTSDPAELTGRWVYLRDTGAGVLARAERTERTETLWEWELRTPEGTVTGSGYPHAAPLSRHARHETRRARRVLRALHADLAEFTPEESGSLARAERDLDLLEWELAAQP